MRENKALIVYSATRSESFIHHLREVFLGFADGMSLGRQLAVRDVRAQFRQSAMGLLWAIVTPIAQTLVWIFLSNRGVLNIGDTGVPYPLFVLTGIMLWQSFIESLNAPLLMFNNAKNILRKININKESLIIAGFLKVLFNLSIKLLVLIPLFFYFSTFPGWQVVLFPFFLLILILFGMTIGIWLTPIGALYTDVQRMIASLTQLLFFLTPIIYSARTEGIFGAMDRYNPIAISIGTARDILLGQSLSDLSIYFIFCLSTLFMLLLALIVYRVSLPIIVERMGS